MKLYEKVLEDRLREELQIGSWQFGFVGGRFTIDAIFIMRQLQEKYKEKKKRLNEKAFDRISREIIEWTFSRRKAPEKMMRMVMLLYEEATSKEKTMVERSEKLRTGLGVHQALALSLLLFITLMEEATKEFRGESLFELLHKDDLVLIGETMEEVRNMFMGWRNGMEKRTLKINVEKTRVMMVTEKNIQLLEES